LLFGSLEGIAVHTREIAIPSFQLPLYFFGLASPYRDGLDSRSEAWRRNENIVSTLRKRQLEIAVDVGMCQQSHLFFGRDNSANEDACSLYGCTHYVDDMPAYLSGFGLLR